MEKIQQLFVETSSKKTSSSKFEQTHAQKPYKLRPHSKTTQSLGLKNLLLPPWVPSTITTGIEEEFIEDFFQKKFEINNNISNGISSHSSLLNNSPQQETASITGSIEHPEAENFNTVEIEEDIQNSGGHFPVPFPFESVDSIERINQNPPSLHLLEESFGFTSEEEDEEEDEIPQDILTRLRAMANRDFGFYE